MAINNFLMQVTDVKGESKEEPDWIDVDSWSYGLSSPIDPATRMSRGATQVQDFILTKGIDKTSPVLIDFCRANKLIDLIKVECRKLSANGVSSAYFKIEMRGARIKAVSTKAVDHKDNPVESVTISFKQIKWIHPAGTEVEFDATHASA